MTQNETNKILSIIAEVYPAFRKDRKGVGYEFQDLAVIQNQQHSSRNTIYGSRQQG